MPPGARRPEPARTGQLSQSSRSAARDQLVLATRVDLEQEELTVDQIPVRVELDRLPEDRGRLVRVLDLRQHVGAAGGLAGLADGGDGLVDHVCCGVTGRAERAEGAILRLR